MKTIGFIGTGNMASALIKAVLKAKIVSHRHVVSSDKSEERLEAIKETKIHTTNDNIEVVNKADVIFLCVKPQFMDKVVEEIKDKVEGKLIISIAAGIRLRFFERLKGARLVRVMPNTPCLVGEMAAGYTMGKNTDEKDKEIVKKILNSAGIAFELKEELMDVVTGLNSTPAFFAYFFDAFKEAAVEEGMGEDIAKKLAEQNALGTAKLMLEKGLSAEEVIKMVSSPGGTTVAGREILEESDVKEILKKTLKRAIERSKELGKNQ